MLPVPLLGLLSPGLVMGDRFLEHLSLIRTYSQAVTAPKLPIPPSSGYAAIGLSIFVAIAVVAKHLWVPKKYWVWIPNWNAVGLVSTPNAYCRDSCNI